MPALSDSPPHKTHGYAAWAGLLLVCAFVVMVRCRWLNVPLERDEGEFAYGGQLLLDGVPPFKYLYNIKQPGIQAAYALLMAVFGQTPWGIHCGLMVANLAAIVLIFFLARQFFGSIGSVAAAASYGLMSLSSSYLGSAAHATQFVVVAGLAGILLLNRSAETGRRTGLYLAGFLCGLAFELKQQGLMFAIFGVLYLAYIEWRRIWIFIAGCMTPYGVTCLLRWRAGVFANFWKWTWRYAYGHNLTLGQGWQRLGMYIEHHLLWPDLAFWVAGGIGLALTLARKDLPAKRKFFIADLLMCGLLAAAMGLYFQSHYFILLLPALALINGSVFDAMQRTRAPAPVIVGVALLVCAVCEVGAQFSYLFTMSPSELSWFCYDQAPFTGALVAAQYIKTNSLPNATIAVLESEPEIYFYSHRRSATGYIYAYDFMSQRAFAQEMQNEVVSEVENARPEWIVFVNSPKAWDVLAYSPTTVLDWCKSYIPAHYDLVGVVDQQQAGEIFYTWSPDSVRSAQLGPAGLKIFKRKPSQVKFKIAGSP